jgi:hypothetical protein
MIRSLHLLKAKRAGPEACPCIITLRLESSV